MAVRNKRKCRNCPQEDMSMTTHAPTMTQGVTTLQITSRSEGERLWNHALFGAGACVGMIEGYCRLDMPGIPIAAVKALVTRLQAVITKIEITNEVQPAPQRLSPDESDRASEELDGEEIPGTVQ